MTFIEGVESSVGPIIAVFLAAALLALVITPLVRRIVMRLDIVDRPEARRVNTAPVPRAGGLAIAAAFLSVGAGFVLLNGTYQWVPEPLTIESGDLVALFLGGAVAAAIGAIDDLFDLRARWQLVGQLGLAGLAVVLGIGVDVIANPFGSGVIRFNELFSVGFTVFWIVGMINSINWIDGLDGLSSGIALIAAVTLGMISLTTQISPADHRGAVLCAGRGPGRVPALELPPGHDLRGHERGAVRRATRWPSCRSWARPRSRSPCSCWASRSSIPSGSSSAA